MVNKFEIIKVSRTWLGSKFIYQGRQKKSEQNIGGCDCLGLIMGVAKELNIRSKQGKALIHYDQQHYSPKQLSTAELRKIFSIHLTEISLKDMDYGQLALLEFEQQLAHLAIIANYYNTGFSLIHSWEKLGKVVEHRLDNFWRKKILCLFNLLTI